MIIDTNKLSKYFEMNFTIDGDTIVTGLISEEELEEELFDLLTGFYDGYWLLSKVNKEKLLATDVFQCLLQDYDEFFSQGE
jgi:hypothetical protein